MAQNNFRRFEGGISIKGIFSADPAQGQIGDIYFNTTFRSFRYCFNETPLQWRDMVLGAGTVDGSILRWDAAGNAYVEDTTLVAGTDQFGGAPNSDNDAVKGHSTTIHAGNKTAGTGDGGDLNLSAGTSVGGAKGLVTIDGESLRLNIALAADPAVGTQGQIYYNTVANTFRYYNGSIWQPLGSGSGGGAFKVTLYDPIDSSLPGSDPFIVDSVQLQDGDTVLFTNLASDPNGVWKAAIASGVITWTQILAFSGLATPSASDQVIIQKGTSFAQQVATYDGTNWKINDIVRYFSGFDYWEQSSIKTTTLNDNTASGDVVTYNVLGSENAQIDYSVVRASQKMAGTLHITSDGTNISLADTGVDLGDAGVSFSAQIVTGVVHIKYTTSSTGSNATMKFMVKRWSDAAGGPSGIPSYTASTSNIVAAGFDTNVQYNDNGNLGGDGGFTWNKATKMLQIGGQTISKVDTINLLDAQNTNQPLFSYAATNQNVIVNYSISRGGDVEVGRMLIPNNGTTAVITTDSAFTNAVGIDFSAAIVGANVQVSYQSTSTGAAATFKYHIQSW